MWDVIFYLILYRDKSCCLYYSCQTGRGCMKIQKKEKTMITESLKVPLKKSRVVDAVVIQAPDLGLYLKLQNLMNFFLDCLKDVLSPAGLTRTNKENIERCLQHVETIYCSNKDDFDTGINKIMDEFFDEINQFNKLITVFQFDNESESKNNPLNVLIAAKSSRLQWLSICVIEELKHPFSATN